MNQHMQNTETEKASKKSQSYSKFLLMILISFLLMYGIMFLNVDSVDHIFLSLNRTYMSLLMVAGMAVIMLLLMPGMYPDAKCNRLILGGGIIVFIVALIFLRKQLFIGDAQYMKGMIPHHSSAIMTSKHADIKDPEVKRLSQEIIRSQQEEIAEMKLKLQELND